MLKRKMYRAQLLVKRDPEDSNRVSIYLLPVQEGIWLDIKSCGKRGFYMAIRILLSIVVTLPFGALAIAAAYHERGYMAFGGEYLLIMWIFIIVFNILGFVNERRY